MSKLNLYQDCLLRIHLLHKYTFIWANFILLGPSVFERAIRSFAWWRTSPISYSASFSLHLWHFIIAPKILKLDFNICTTKLILWLKTVAGKTLQTNESTTNSWEFWCLCKRFPNFYIKWIQIYRKIRLQEDYFQYPNEINTFQR